MQQGKLPPVQERLPKKPLVVQPVERSGQYGGTWRTALLGGADRFWLVRTINYENLVRWDLEWTQVIPNVAAPFEPSPSAKPFAF